MKILGEGMLDQREKLENQYDFKCLTFSLNLATVPQSPTMIARTAQTSSKGKENKQWWKTKSQFFFQLLERQLPYDPACPSVGRSVCHDYLEGGKKIHLHDVPIGALFNQ